MITRAYNDVNDQRQEITLSQEEWDAMTQEGLRALLGFSDPKPAAKAKAAKAEPIAEAAPAEATAEAPAE